MWSKKMSVLAASLLTLSLAACNADNNAGMDSNANDGGYKTNNYQPGVYGTNRNQTGDRMNQNSQTTQSDGRGDGIDHNGPLTEDYQKESGDLDFGTRRNGDLSNAGRGNGIDNNGTRNTDQANNEREMNISSFRTNRSSENYPHTRAILIREARFQYVPVKNDGRNWGGFQQAGQQNRQNQQATPNETQQNIPKQEQQQATPRGNAAPAPTQEQQGTATSPTQKQQNTQQQAQAGISKEAQQVIDLTNEQRRKNGLAPLKADPQLSGVAQKKSEDMQQKGYFSHTSPTYGSPFDMMRDFGISYKTAGENIAQGQRTPQEVVQAWMNSQGHRENILNPNFTHIGVGHAATGHHWTQMFIGK